jgi:hypothetical protein
MTLPNFLVIGAAKSGTTSLHHYLSQHPEIFMAPGMLGGFFAFEGQTPVHNGPSDWEMDRYAVTDIAGYRGQFDRASGEKAVGEVCAAYLCHPKAAERIRARLPDVKLLAILRHPVERAYSNYMHKLREGAEPLTSFSDALEAEARRIRDGWQYTWHYQARSRYFDQLRPYYQLFAKEQIRVHLYDDLCQRPLLLLRDIFGFLGVDQRFEPDTSIRFQATGVPRSRRLATFVRRPSAVKTAYRAVMPARYRQRITMSLEGLNLRKPSLTGPIRQDLQAGLREDVLKLQDLIGRDLSHWLR